MLSQRHAQPERSHKHNGRVLLSDILDNKIAREQYEDACTFVEKSDYSIPDKVVHFLFGFASTKSPTNSKPISPMPQFLSTPVPNPSGFRRKSS